MPGVRPSLVRAAILACIDQRGGVLFNYTRQINDGMDVTSTLVGSGVLDPIPDARILSVEHGAGWLMGAAQQMDEVYIGHAPYIEPKLSRMPSKNVRDQVRVMFQNDVGCLLTRKVVVVDALIFATATCMSKALFMSGEN